MKKECLEDALTQIDAAYLDEAAKAAGSSKKTRRSGPGRILLIAAALAVLLIAGISAVSPADLSFYLDKTFHGGYDLIDGMTSVPRSVAYSSSGGGIRLEMKGIVGDGQAADVFFDIIVDPNSGLTDKNLYFVTDIDRVWSIFRLPKADGSHSWNQRELGRETAEDGSVVYRMCCGIKSGDLKRGDDLAVRVSTVFTVDFEAQQKQTLLTGKWSMVFTLDYEDISKVIPLDLEITPAFRPFGSEEECVTCPLHLREVRISPLSLMLTGDCAASDDPGGTEFAEVGIQYRDGSCVPQSSAYRMGGGMVVLNDDGTWRDASAEEIAAWESRNTITGGSSSSRADPDDPGRLLRTWIWTFSSELDYENAVCLLLGGEAVELQ